MATEEEEEATPIAAEEEGTAPVASEEETAHVTIVPGAEEKAARIAAAEKGAARSVDAEKKAGLMARVSTPAAVEEAARIAAARMPAEEEATFAAYTEDPYAGGIDIIPVPEEETAHVTIVPGAEEKAARIAAAEEGASRMEAAEKKAGIIAMVAPSAAEEGAARMEAAEEKAGLMAVLAPSAAEEEAVRSVVAEWKAGLIAMVSRPAADGGAARMEAAEEKAALVSPPAASFRFAARLAAAEEKAGLIAKDAPHATEVGAALMMTAEPPIASSSSVLSGSSGSPSRLEEIRMRRNLAEIAGRSKIEEITERTLALEAALDASTSAPTDAGKGSETESGGSDEITALRSVVTTLRSELRMSRSVGLSATARIANLERENAALRSDLRSIYTNLRRSRTELSQLGTRTELERCLVQAVAMLDDMGVELSKALKDEGMVRTVAGRVVEAREVAKLQDKDREVMEGRVIAEQLGLACAASLRSERAKVVTQLAESGILPPLTAVEEGSEDFQDVMADDIDLINAGITQSAARMERSDPTDDVTSEDVKANLEEEDKSAMLIQSTWRWNTVGHADSADGALINDATSERNTEEFGADFEDVVLEDWMVKV